MRSREQRVVGAALGPASTAQALLWAAARADWRRARAGAYRPPLAPGILAGRYRWERRHFAAAVLQRAFAERRLAWANKKTRLRLCVIAVGARARVVAFSARQRAARMLTEAALAWLYAPQGPMVRASIRSLWQVVGDGEEPPAALAATETAPPPPLGPAIRPADSTAFGYAPLSSFNAGYLLQLCRANALSEGLLKTLQAHCRAG